jgi:hypothetical protein
MRSERRNGARVTSPPSSARRMPQL